MSTPVSGWAENSGNEMDRVMVNRYATNDELCTKPKIYSISILLWQNYTTVTHFKISYKVNMDMVFFNKLPDTLDKKGGRASWVLKLNLK